jgi:hypothetical protein
MLSDWCSEPDSDRTQLACRPTAEAVGCPGLFVDPGCGPWGLDSDSRVRSLIVLQDFVRGRATRTVLARCAGA